MFRIFLFVLAIIISGSATWLTSWGMSQLFSGLLFLFIIIDIARFFVTDYLIKDWKYIGKMKYFTTGILSLLLILSSVGVYNALDQRIPKTMHDSIVTAATYNRQVESNKTNQDINKTGYEIALQEYNSSIAAYEIQKNSCLEKKDADAEKCAITYNKNLNNAKYKLNQAKKEYTQSINKTTESANQEVQNKTEIAGILTTICSFTGGHCDTTEGLTRALRIIILLIIIGLEIFAINILFIIHSDKMNNKPINFKLPEFPKLKKEEKKIEVKEEVKSEPVISEIKEEKKKEEIIKEKPIKEEKKKIFNIPFIKSEKVSIMDITTDEGIYSQIANKSIRTFDELIKFLNKNKEILQEDRVKEILNKNPRIYKAIKQSIS